jgi:hypothetical protein
VAGTTTMMSMRATAAPRSCPPPTKPRTGNHGAAGGFNHGDHGAAAVGSCVAAAGGLRDPTGGLQLRPRRPRRRGGQVSRGVRWQWAASEIQLVVGGFNLGGHGAKVVGSRAAAAGGLRDPAGGGRLQPRRPRPPPQRHDINGCRPGSRAHTP